MHYGAPTHSSRAMRDVLNITHTITLFYPQRLYLSSHLIKISFPSDPVQNVSPRSEQELHRSTVNACQIIRNSPEFFERVEQTVISSTQT
jgi:hypothetical protein